MKPTEFLTGIILLLCVSGCSKSIPSDEDAKKAISNLTGGCEYLSIENFKKTNGMQKDDNNYVVSIEYEINVKPIPEIKKIIEEQSAKLSDINERLQQAHNQMVAAAEVTGALFEKDEVTGERWKNACENHAKFIELQERIEMEKSEFLNGTVNPVAKFSDRCPSTNRVLYANLYSGDDLSQYAKEFTKQFSGNLAMIKTENGWIPAN